MIALAKRPPLGRNGENNCGAPCRADAAALLQFGPMGFRFRRSIKILLRRQRGQFKEES